MSNIMFYFHSIRTGGKIKSIVTTRWVSSNTNSTNESGFTALPSGFRFNNDGFSLELALRVLG